jgi:DNA-binding NarL/FixJ family response regulator
MTNSSVDLTPRERDVVRGVLNGHTNREIATALGLTIQAVKNVLSAVYAKCHVRNRLELALFAVRNDILPGAASLTNAADHENPERIPVEDFRP